MGPPEVRPEADGLNEGVGAGLLTKVWARSREAPGDGERGGKQEEEPVFAGACTGEGGGSASLGEEPSGQGWLQELWPWPRTASTWCTARRKKGRGRALLPKPESREPARSSMAWASRAQGSVQRGGTTIWGHTGNVPGAQPPAVLRPHPAVPWGGRQGPAMIFPNNKTLTAQQQ